MKINNKTKFKVLLVIAIAITLITGLTASYAFFVYRADSKETLIDAGKIKIAFANGNNYLNVENFYPISDYTGKILPYYSDFNIDAITNNIDIKYEIQIVPNDDNTIDTKYIKVYLTDQDDNPLTNVSYYNNLTDASLNEGAKMVYTDYIRKTESKDFRLRVWIDKSYSTKTIENFGFTIYLYAINDDSKAD